jgi:alkylhydroperoxidase family enzyme
MDIGSAVGRESGITEDQILDLPRHRESNAYTDVEKLVLDYAEAMSLTPVQVSETLFKDLSTHFDHGELVELTATISWENQRARFNRALMVDAHGFTEGSVCALPDPGPAAT